MIYLFVFVTSILLFYEYEKKKQKWMLFIALFLPVAISILRKNSVGIDVEIYMKPLFEVSTQQKTLIQFLSNYSSHPSLVNMEIGYATLCYIVSKISNGMWGIFLLNSILSIFPVYFGTMYLNKMMQKQNINCYFPVWLVFSAYYFLFFPNSLNQVRQHIVVCFLPIVFGLILSKRYILEIAIVLLLSMIHISAPILLVFNFFFYLVNKNQAHKLLWLKKLYIIGLVVLFLFSKQIFTFILNFGLKLNFIPDKYVGQIINGFNQSFNPNITNFLFLFFIIIINVIFVKRDKKIFPILTLSLLTAISLSTLDGFFDNFGRIQLYFLFALIFVIPYIYNCLNIKKNYDELLKKFVVYFSLFLYWVITYNILDGFGVSKYLFFWQ